MEQNRLNRLCVIPDYTSAEIKALLRDPLHRSNIVPKIFINVVNCPNVWFCVTLS